MAQEVESFDVTIPAGTTKASNFSRDISFSPRVVREIDVRIPPGPRGEVGFSIGSSGQPVLPKQAGRFIVGNDEVIAWPLDGYWDSGSWTLFGYNTGRYDHTLEVRFLVDVPQELAGAAGLSGTQIGMVGVTGHV